MRNEIVYDIAGIGIGPFNLGLAALCRPVENLKTIFIEQKPDFNWHEGMMIPGTTLQVSYLADLVTLADPSSQFSYLNFLRKHNRLLQFGIHENNYITRREYNRYCKWVCSALDNLLFGSMVEEIIYDEQQDIFEIMLRDSNTKSCKKIYTKHIVVGTGTKPFVPSTLERCLGKRIIHSSNYMHIKQELSSSKQIVVVGSGQSAAEIFYDLLNDGDLSSKQLSWFTRSDRFYAMEYSKLNYEMTSPDYIDFFYGLDANKKEAIPKNQFSLYKGINHQLINAIYDKLYALFTEQQKYKVRIQANAELLHIDKKSDHEFSLEFYHKPMDKNFVVSADFVILATGYHYEVPGFLKKFVRSDVNGKFYINRNYSVDGNNCIFVQNAELNTHGFNAPDLGLGAYRNAVIINTILKQKYYPVDEGSCFQTFGMAG